MTKPKHFEGFEADQKATDARTKNMVRYGSREYKQLLADARHQAAFEAWAKAN